MSPKTLLNQWVVPQGVVGFRFAGWKDELSLQMWSRIVTGNVNLDCRKYVQMIRCVVSFSKILSWTGGVLYLERFWYFFWANAAEKRKHQAAYQAHQQTLQMKKKRPCHPVSGMKNAIPRFLILGKPPDMFDSHISTWTIMNLHEAFWCICRHHLLEIFIDDVGVGLPGPGSYLHRQAAGGGPWQWHLPVSSTASRSPRTTCTAQGGQFFILNPEMPEQVQV